MKRPNWKESGKKVERKWKENGKKIEVK